MRSVIVELLEQWSQGKEQDWYGIWLLLWIPDGPVQFYPDTKNAADRRYFFFINTAVQDAVFRTSGPNVLIHEELKDHLVIWMVL